MVRASKKVVGIVGFGEVGQALTKRFTLGGHEVLAYNHGRSERPPYSAQFRRKAKKTGAYLVDRAEALRRCEVVFICVPGEAAALAHERLAAAGVRAVADLSSARPDVKRRGTAAFGSSGYLDLALAGAAAGLVGGGSGDPLILAAGPHDLVSELASLGLPLEHIGPNPGAAADMKTMWQVVTKTLQALALEVHSTYSAMGLEYRPPPAIVVGGASVGFDLPFLLLDHLQLHRDRKADDLEVAIEYLEGQGGVCTVARAAVAAIRSASSHAGGREL